MPGYKEIAQRIESRVYRKMIPGSSFQSERELADTYSVSRTTIRRALKLLEERSIIEIRHGSGIRVSSRLPGVKHYVIGIVSQYSQSEIDRNPIYKTLVSHIEKQIVAIGDSYIFLEIDNWKEQIDSIDCWITIAIDGEGEATIKRIAATGKPIIVVDYAAHGIEADAVAFDIYGTGFKTAMELIQAGHRRIGFIGEKRGSELSEMSFAAHEAYSGFKICYENLGGKIEFIHSQKQENIDALRRNIRSEKNAMEKVTALVVCFPDHIDPIIEELDAMSLSVPRDVSILVIGDWLEKTAGGLTIARFSANYEAMGQEATELAERRLRDNYLETKKILIQRNFIPGDTLVKI